MPPNRHRIDVQKFGNLRDGQNPTKFSFNDGMHDQPAREALASFRLVLIRLTKAV